MFCIVWMLIWIIWIFCLNQVFTIVNNPKQPDPQRWLLDLRNYIEQESSTQQIILIIDNQQQLQDPRTSTIIRILNNFPTHIFSIDNFSKEMNNLHFFKLPLLKIRPRTTTIFIMIVPPNENLFLKTEQLTTIVSKLSRAWTRPRSLVIHPTEEIYPTDIYPSDIYTTDKYPTDIYPKEEKSSYKNILQLAWSRQFLDFTLIQLTERYNLANSKESLNSLANSKKRLNLANYKKTKATLHIFNPFTNLYTKTSFFPGVKWFPDKLQNLNNHLMKVGVINYLPYSRLTYDKLGNPSYSGTDFKIMKTLSEAMNFRMQVEDKEDYGLFNCDPNKTTGLMWNLTHNQIQMMGLRLSVTDTCNWSFSSAMRMTEMIGFCAVVPILFLESKPFFIRWQLLYALLLIVLLLMIIVVVSRLFQFQKMNWTFTQIVSIILGVTVPREPVKIKERIIFGCFLIACAFYSSNIFAEVTQNFLQEKTERVIETLDELYDSELIPVMHPSLAYTLSRENEGLAKKLVEKSLKTTDNSEKCLEMLVRFKNVSCIMRDIAAKFVMDKMKGECGKVRMKIVKQRLWTFPITFLLEPGSPYVDRFDDLMMKMEASGLVVEWNKEVLGRSDGEFHEEESCNSRKENLVNIFPALCWCLFNGYLVSVIVFIREVVKARCVKKSCW